MAGGGHRIKPQMATAAVGERRRNLAAFWLLGLLNNISYVILLAGAAEISAGGVGLVFLADIAPTFLVKLTAPYWCVSQAWKWRRAAAVSASAPSDFFKRMIDPGDPRQPVHQVPSHLLLAAGGRGRRAHGRLLRHGGGGQELGGAAPRGGALLLASG